MKVSLSWLQDYVTIDTDLPELAQRLTMAGLEVDALVDRYAYLDGVVVGVVMEITPHPNADTLSVCRVNVGSGVRQIVCGAPNVRKGCLAPVALPGVKLPSGHTVEAVDIRGQTSDGMLCSEGELGVGADTSGILLLPNKSKPGLGVVAALSLSDTVLEFDLTPNRSDCLSVMGIAREVAALLGTPLRRSAIKLPKGGTPVDDLTSVTIGLF